MRSVMPSTTRCDKLVVRPLDREEEGFVLTVLQRRSGRHSSDD
jgi:hypothetical protein